MLEERNRLLAQNKSLLATILKNEGANEDLPYMNLDTFIGLRAMIDTLEIEMVEKDILIESKDSERHKLRQENEALKAQLAEYIHCKSCENVFTQGQAIYNDGPGEVWTCCPHCDKGYS